MTKFAVIHKVGAHKGEVLTIENDEADVAQFHGSKFYEVREATEADLAEMAAVEAEYGIEDDAWEEEGYREQDVLSRSWHQESEGSLYGSLRAYACG